MSLALLVAAQAPAASLSPQTFVDATNQAVGDIAALAGLGADLHAYEAARPYSSLGGFDLGLSATAIAIPGSATNALTVLGITNIPHYIPIPKINFQKAITKRILIGTEFIPNIKIQGNKISMYGVDAQWTAIDRPGLPPIAIRGQFNYTNLAFVSATTYGGDVLTSWQLPLINIYGGGGYRFVNANITNPTTSIPTLPGVRLDATLDAGHMFSGATFTVGPARFTAEADLTTRGVNTYGTKISFYF